jgi:hypothetical protein
VTRLDLPEGIASRLSVRQCPTRCRTSSKSLRRACFDCLLRLSTYEMSPTIY